MTAPTYIDDDDDDLTPPAVFTTNEQDHALHVRDRAPVAWCAQCVGITMCHMIETRRCPPHDACQDRPCARIETVNEGPRRAPRWWRRSI